MVRLTPLKRQFALEYLRNGLNATQAYLHVRPKVERSTAGREGHRLTKDPKIREYLEARLRAYWQAEEMSVEEVIARVARDARLDVRGLFGENGKMLPVKDWPDELAGSVRSYDPTSGKVTFNSSLEARKVLLELVGKIRGVGSSFDALAEALKADIETHTGTRVD